MENIVMMTEEDYKTIPTYSNFFIDDMDDVQKNTFLLLISMYRKMMILFLINNTNIKKYDDLLASSYFKYIPIENINKDLYQFSCKDDLNYFYLRNNIHIENLTNDERKFLYSKYSNDSFNFDEEMQSFIVQTYRKVIFEDVRQKGNCLINYGPISPNFIAPNNALVIGVRYDDFNLNGQSEKEWNENYEKQQEYLNRIINELENEIKKRLNIACRVIKYNEFSIIVNQKSN